MKEFFKLKPILIIASLVMIVTAFVPAFSQRASAQGTSPGDWLTYLHDNGRSGYNGAETVINPTSAPNLKLKWSYTSTGCPNSPGGPHEISTQPVVVSGLGIFWGSWDGCEHATDLSGNQKWATYIGQTNQSGNPNCSPPIIGVASTVTYTTVHGNKTPVVLVGGGDANFYGLDANTGAIIWKTPLGSPTTGQFIWSSPAVYNGSVYVGVASFGDCPLVQGKIVQMKVNNGVIQNTFNLVPNGCTGGSLWGSPTIDVAAGTVYFATGNPGSCSQPEPYAIAVVELSASNLSYIGSWQVPTSQQVPDGDFGSTPTLFQATINGSSKQLLGVANKNGIYYTFARGNLGQGPVWQTQIAIGGDCCGNGSLSPSAWDGSTLYAAGGNTTINGTSYKGSLQALNPATGSFIWRVGFTSGNVIAAVTAVPGVAVVGAGPHVYGIAMASGNILVTLNGGSGAAFYGGASISNGVLYEGDSNGNIFAFVP